MTVLNTRHFAVLGGSAVAVANIMAGGSEQITLAAIAILGAAFTWDKLEKGVGIIQGKVKPSGAMP